uniref:Essential MCU regulator, mitochondrial n=1 Tax=Steinernema glaseri TaxID=37863 RepID=A0A1I7ZAY6_9BILA
MNSFVPRLISFKVAHDALLASQQAVLRSSVKTVSRKPYQLPHGLFKLIAVGGASMYLGGLLAKNGASFLEENEIFVPSDEDDDD